MHKPPAREYGFKPGQSGNPGGRPKSNLARLLAQYLDGTDKGERVKREQKLVEKLYKLAVSGDRGAIEYIFDRLEGKITQDLNVSGDITGRIIIVRPGVDTE